MSILSKLRKYRKDIPDEPESQQEETQEEQAKCPNEKEEEIRERISKFLYDERLVEELLPVFVRIDEVQGAESVFELIEAKETQLTNVLDNEEAFKQDSDPEEKDIPESSGDENDDDNEDYVMKILTEKYGE